MEARVTASNLIIEGIKTFNWRWISFQPGGRTVERLNSANTTDHKYLKRIEKGVEIREINSSFSR